MLHTTRLQALRRLQAAHGVDCVALIPGPNLRYFTGLDMHLSERTTVALLGAAGPDALLLPVLEVPAARAQLAEDVLMYTYQDGEGHEGAFLQMAQDLALADRSIGIEYLAMRVLEMQRLQQVAPGCRLLATEPWLPELRSVKADEEVALVRRAVAIAEQAMERLLQEAAIRPGRTERNVAADLRVALLREGAHGEAFSPIVVSGPNSAFPHAAASDRIMEEGDLVVVDWGAIYEGYRSDITRTFVLGSPTAEMERMHDAVLAANQSGRLAVRTGMPAQEVDRAARRSITLAGLGEYFLHRTGHGLGLETHEPPYLVEGNLVLLTAGMICTVEPGVYVPGVGGVRIEDDVLVSEKGAETLTTLPRDLMTL